MRALLLAVVYLVYFVTLILISLAISARTPTSRLSLLILLTFWFANSLVAPRAMADLAAWMYPTPSAIEFQKALDADLNDQQEMTRRLDRRRAELFERYSVTNVDALPIAFSGVSLQEGEEHGNEVFDKHYGRLFGRYDQQNRVLQVGGLFAPMLAVRSLSMGLAGSDFFQHRDFATAAEAYRRDIQRVMNGDIAANQRKGQVYLADQTLWAKVPEFEYAPPSTSTVLRHYAVSLLVMAGWLAIAVAAMVRGASGGRVD